MDDISYYKSVLISAVSFIKQDNLSVTDRCIADHSLMQSIRYDQSVIGFNLKPDQVSKIFDSNHLSKDYCKLSIEQYDDFSTVKITSWDENGRGDTYRVESDTAPVTLEVLRAAYKKVYLICKDLAWQRAEKQLIEERAMQLLMSHCLEKPEEQ